MKKLLLISVLFVSGLLYSQEDFDKKDFHPINFMLSYPLQLSEFDSIVYLSVDDSIKEEMIQELVNNRYGKILGERYEIDVLGIYNTNKDVSLYIFEREFFKDDSPNFFNSNSKGFYETNLSNVEKCFQLGILQQEIEDIMIDVEIDSDKLSNIYNILYQKEIKDTIELYLPTKSNWNETLFPIRLDEFDSLVSLSVVDSIKIELIQQFINKRYGKILGERYEIVVLGIYNTFESIYDQEMDIDVSILIVDKEYYDVKSTNYFNQKNKDIFNTFLSNVEKSFKMGKLLDDIKKIMSKK